MAYSDLYPNQAISFNNLQSGVNQGVFTAKITIPTSQKQITKTEASTYVNINTSLPSFAAKSSNQLVTKNDLSGIVTITGYLMYGVAGTSGYKSTDGGKTFTALTGLPSLSWTAMAGDITGNYIAAISYSQNNQIYISTDGGASFTATTISYILTGFYATGVSMSDNGQYISVAGLTTVISEKRNAVVSISSNYGASFSAGYGDSTAYKMYNIPSGKVSVSGNGQYITSVFAYSVDPGFPNVPRPWSFRIYSSNYGATWTKSGGSEFSAFFDIALSYTGQYQFITLDWMEPGVFGSIGMKAYVSNDYGASFSERFSNTTAFYLGGDAHQGFVSATISDDGRTMVGATDGKVYVSYTSGGLPPALIASTDYGNSFPTFTQGFIGNVGIAGGNITASSVTNNYISMMLYNIGQYNYSNNGGTTFIPATNTAHNWTQIYRKAYTTYTPPPTPTYDFYYATQYNCPGCSFNASNVLVAFPTGTSYISTHYYSALDGYVYKITSDASEGTAVLLDPTLHNSNCTTICSL